MELNIKKEQLGKSKVKLEITISKKDFDNFCEQALEKLKAEVELPGFRKGKAPDKMVIEKLGETRIESEALDLAVRQSTYSALAQENIIPVDSPKVAIKQFEKEKDLIYSLEVSIMPEVVLGDYKKVKVSRTKVKIEKAEVEKAIEDLRKRMATMEDKKEGLRRGDWAEIEFEGSIKGVKMDKLSSKNFPLIVGEIQFIPGFEEKIIDMKKGEEREFELKIPQNADAELKNKTAKFKVKIHQVKTIILPELNQDFAQKLGAKDLGDLKQRMETALKNQKELEAENRYKVDLINQVSEKSKIELPESLINQEKERLLADFSRQLSMSGMTVEQFLEGQKKTKENLEKDFVVQAEKNVKVGLTLAEISKQEKIEVTAAEIDEEINRIINQGTAQGLKKADLVKTYELDENRRYVEHTLKNKKTIDKIVELNK